jgi:hypothetical protein
MIVVTRFSPKPELWWPLSLVRALICQNLGVAFRLSDD